ncbi:MAG: hypothetical protein M0D55_03420 [Elusimicrobiota bacterium]|nr:MAG: hypothetical protein M0D55_03420 [Elusimicrobiota bacterium]
MIKTVAHSAGIELMAAQSPRATAAGEKESADLLAAADAGPRHFGGAVVDGALVSVRERVYGETLEALFRAKRFRAEDRALVVEMLGRMAAAGVMTDDLRPSNIMIGTTRIDARRRAYVVDGGRPVEQEGGVAGMLRRTIVLRANFVRDVGWIEHASTLELMMEEGLERSSRDTAWKKVAGFFKDLGAAMVP